MKRTWWIAVILAGFFLSSGSVSAQVAEQTGKIIFQFKTPGGTFLSSDTIGASVYRVDEAKKTEEDVTCRDASRRRVDFALNQPYCVSPGLYRIAFDPFQLAKIIVGYPLKPDSFLVRVENNQTVTKVVPVAELRVTYLLYDRSPVKNLHFRIHGVKVDANGAKFPDPLDYAHEVNFTTGTTGETSILLSPGEYFLSPVERYSRTFDDFSQFFGDRLITLRPEESRSLTLQTGLVEYVPRNEDGSLRKLPFSAFPNVVIVYTPNRDANGTPLPPGFDFAGTYTTISDLGSARLNVLPGTYSLVERDPNGKVLFAAHDIVVEPGVARTYTNRADWGVSNGHYFTQAGQSAGGFSVRNESGIPFWDEYNRLGGVEWLGYPISNRFVFKGSIVQVFQKTVLTWNPSSASADIAPVLDWIAEQKGASWLDQHQVPGSTLLSDDDSFNLLASVPLIADKYLSEPRYKVLYGSPGSLVETDQVVALRLDKAVLQLWKIDVPGLRAGWVTIMNSGDLFKEAGFIPPQAAVPGPPS